jgi:hypothetical protein
VSYLLRVALPDIPGSLGALASALGEVGADIVSLDVVARTGGAAVDDLLVELPMGRMADSLVTACHTVPGVRVESLRRYVGAGDLHRDLELVEAMAADPATAAETLIAGAPGVFRADWAALVTVDSHGPAVIAESTGAPDLDRVDLPWLPMTAARAFHEDEPWIPGSCHDTALAAAPLGRPDAAVLIGRAGGPTILPGELSRLAHLAALASTIGAANRA